MDALYVEVRRIRHREHVAALREAAARPPQRCPRASLRERIGCRLVATGLRIAYGRPASEPALN